MRFWDGLAVEVFTVVGVTALDLQRGREIALEWPDQSFSIVDCTSFAIIERLGIERALAFDVHFRVIRLGPRRGRALRVIAP
jgi:predicted nucleic acid-binding protein